MNAYNDVFARKYLAANGVSAAKADDVVKGFDLGAPVYETRLSAGDIIFQFVRRPSAGNGMPRLGNWFCLAGAELSGLAIISGGEGRVACKVRVIAPMTVLEGTASPQAVNWGWSGGGKGGTTQMFMPDRYLTRNITVVGFTSNVAGIAITG